MNSPLLGAVFLSSPLSLSFLKYLAVLLIVRSLLLEIPWQLVCILCTQLLHTERKMHLLQLDTAFQVCGVGLGWSEWDSLVAGFLSCMLPTFPASYQQLEVILMFLS